MTEALLNEPPFVVEQHRFMFMRVAGKRPDTVLTLEKLIYAWRICEYSEPLFIARSWWYKDEEFGIAIGALLTFLEQPAATEPGDWLRADDIHEGSTRIRRAHVEAGERVITVNGEDGL